VPSASDLVVVAAAPPNSNQSMPSQQRKEKGKEKENEKDINKPQGKRKPSRPESWVWAYFTVVKIVILSIQGHLVIGVAYLMHAIRKEMELQIWQLT